MIYIETNTLYIQVTSPYVSLEVLDEPDYKAIAQHRSPNHRIYSSDSHVDSVGIMNLQYYYQSYSSSGLSLSLHAR